MIVLLATFLFAGTVWMSQAYHNKAWPFLPYDWTHIYEKKASFVGFSGDVKDTLYILQYSPKRDKYRIKWFGYEPRMPYDTDAYYACLNYQLNHDRTSVV